MAVIGMGDQFLALSAGRTQPPDTGRHFGLVVDDRSQVMALAESAGAKLAEGRQFNILDLWGNHIKIVSCSDVQYMKNREVLRSMGLTLQKSDAALEELWRKGISATTPDIEGCLR